MPASHPTGSAVREPTVTLDDLTGGLLWPKLLRAPALALRPERWVCGVACVVLVGLIGRISALWNEEFSFNELVAVHVLSPLASLADAATPWDAAAMPVGSAAYTLLYAPVNLLVDDPAALFLLGIPMLLVWGVAGVMIARSAACEVALGRILPWPETLGFALSKWVGALGAVIAPIVLVAVVHLLIAVAGAALFSWPVGDVLGALLFGLALLGAFFAVLVALGYLLGWTMLLPAIACEGTDALDAIQRVYAYVIGRPLRLVLYLVIATLVGALALGVVGWVVTTGESMASRAASQWAGTHGRHVLLYGELPELDRAPDPAMDSINAEPGAPAQARQGPPATLRAARSVVGFWRSVLSVAIAGYVVSLLHTAGTLVYLLCRRVNDGQEIAELWTPDAR